MRTHASNSHYYAACAHALCAGIDQGDGFEWQKFLSFDPDRAFDPNGRGIAMAKMMSFSALDYEGRGNIVVARVNL